MTSSNNERNSKQSDEGNGSKIALNSLVRDVNNNVNNDMENTSKPVKTANRGITAHNTNSDDNSNELNVSMNDDNVSHETPDYKTNEESNNADTISVSESKPDNAHMNDNNTTDNANSVINANGLESTNTGSVLVNNVKSFFIDDKTSPDGDRANKWSYILMIAITLLAVFATVFGSYEYHQRVNMSHTFTAVYDNDSKTWYTDPMNGRVMKIKQFHQKDMRIYTTSLVNPITNDYGNPALVRHVDKFKWKNGLIANITCNKPFYNADTNELSCYGSIVVNTYNVDETALDYAKTVSMKTDLKKQVITRIDR